jgi:hypothetical protein
LCPREETIAAFKKAFSAFGYEVCEHGKYEEGFRKIAVYAKGDKPKHAARQLESGQWTSKLGRSFDIEHSLEALEGTHYGRVVLYFRCPI